MNFLLEGSDLLAPDPGLLRARGLATRPGIDSAPGRGGNESPFSSFVSAYELRSAAGWMGLEASFSWAAVAAWAAASKAAAVSGLVGLAKAVVMLGVAEDISHVAQDLARL